MQLLETIVLGGTMMIPLMIESVIALGVIIDRAVAFRNNSKIDTRALRAKVLALLAEDKPQDAALLCSNTPGPVSAVLLAGLQSYLKYLPLSHNPQALRSLVEDSMETYSQQAMSSVEKRMTILSFISNSAPLLGMTGTVTGMITAFGAMASAGALEGSIVAGGISEALITTAAGLLIAIAAVIPYHYFMSIVNRIEMDILEASSEVLDFITLKHSAKSA